MNSNPENLVKNVHFKLYCAELWLLVLIEVINRTKVWVESVSQKHLKYNFLFLHDRPQQP